MFGAPEGVRMGAGLFSGDPTGDPAGVLCDPDCWSAESKRSVAYEFRPPMYRDKAYRCRRCGAPDVFTAADQKHAFEVRKANISQQRVLCEACHRGRAGLEQQAGECRRRWAAERGTLVRDSCFLRQWLEVLESLPGYGGANDEASITMLRRLIAEVERHAEPDGAPDSGRDIGYAG
jgi:Probable zinc-ribbon domain